MGKAKKYRSPRNRLLDQATVLVAKANRDGRPLNVHEEAARLVRENPEGAMSIEELDKYLLRLAAENRLTIAS